MELVCQNNVCVIGVIYMFKELDLHLSHGGRPGGAFFFLNIETVSVDSVFGGENNFSHKLFDMFLFDWNVIEKYGGGFLWEEIVGNKVNYFLSKLPVFYGIWA